MTHNLLSSTSLSTGFKSVLWAHPTLEDIKDYTDMLDYRKYLSNKRELDKQTKWYKDNVDGTYKP